MVYTNTKYWSFTWDTNIKQRKIPSSHDLVTFLNSFCSAFVFQKEKGSKKGKIHIQGCLTLEGPRMSKKALISRIQERFPNVHGLTLSPVHDKLAIQNYVTKTKGRVEGPFFGGTQEVYCTGMAKAKLRKWQQDLFDFLKGPSRSYLKNRKVVRLEDLPGNSGKSWFLKWLRTGQKELVCRLLPISSVDRLTSAVNLISKKEKIDVYMIDMTRTRGEKQSLKDIFSVIEQIKNGFVIDVMYGKYNEALFDPPIILICTNQRFEDHSHFLSADRWLNLSIQNNELTPQSLLHPELPKALGPFKDILESEADSPIDHENSDSN